MGIKLDDVSSSSTAEEQQQKQRRPMGQRYAKHQMQSGVRVYHQRHYQQAIGRWRAALNRLKNAEDRFITLGYMAQAFCDCSDYESMLHYALQQMELANSRRDDFMKSEAFLNLAKAYERLADYGKSICYGRASLHHPNIDSRTPGYAHLGIALAHLGLSQFQSALEAFEKAMAVANETGDKLLELQICVGLGTLFTLLRDLGKALIFLRNALSILQLVTADNVHAKHKSTILYHLSVVLRLKGSLADARQVCDESLRLAYQTSNRATYARALASMADINRELGESEAKETITKSWARYEQSFRVMRQIKDRMGEVIVLGSMAKSASESRSHYTGQCECQAIQLNKKCLELAKMIGCKHAMLKCQVRLQELYAQLEDEESEEAAARASVALVQEMELFCNFCGQRYADRDDALQALRCSHIFHERCLHRFLAEGENLSCPKCKRRAILMQNLSAHTSAESSDVAAAATAAAHPLRFESEIIFDEFGEPIDSALFDPATGRKRLRLEAFAQQQTQQQQQKQQQQQQQEDLYSELKRARQITAPPFERAAPPPAAAVSVLRARAHATVRIPRTTSAPVYCPPGEALYASATTSYAADVEAARRGERASASPQPSTSSNSATIRSAARYGRKIPARHHSVVGSAPTRSNAFMEVGAESSAQHFSLSASTSSVAFYPSASEGALWAAAASSASATNIRQPSALENSTASRSSAERGSAEAPRRFPSRAERMRALASGAAAAGQMDAVGGHGAVGGRDNALDDGQRPSTSGIKSLKIFNPLSELAATAPPSASMPSFSASKLGASVPSASAFSASKLGASTSSASVPSASKLGASASSASKLSASAFSASKLGALASSASKLGASTSSASVPSASKLGASASSASKLSALASSASKLGASTSDRFALGKPGASNRCDCSTSQVVDKILTDTQPQSTANAAAALPETQPSLSFTAVGLNAALRETQPKAQPKKAPPPPPRKPPPPCCGGADAFPPLADDVLNAPPPSLAFPSMLERAMRTVLEENEEAAGVDFEAFERACVVEYPPLAAAPSRAATAGAAGAVPNNVEHADEKVGGEKLPNNNRESAPRDDERADGGGGERDKERLFIVHHGEGVTDV